MCSFLKKNFNMELEPIKLQPYPQRCVLVPNTRTMLSPKVLTPSSILDSFADLKKQLDNNLNGRKVPILGITVIFYSLLLSLFLVIIKRKISKIVPPLVSLDFLPEPTNFFLRGSRVKFKPVHVCFDSARCINEGFEIEGARMLT